MSAAAIGDSDLIVRQLADKVTAFNPAMLTEKAVKQARTCILDTIGVVLAGVPEPCTQILLRTPGVANGPGKALLFGSSRRTSALDATLVNGTASHALDFDDVSGVLGGHPSVPLVAALFALAEERELGGQELVTAYVIGAEVEIRLARAVNFHHYDKGWHPTATLGVFGAAAAASHLLRLDAGRTAVALAIAASFASGIKANFGTMTKPLHVGHCGRNGLLAALLAEGGFDAASNVFEHPHGFLNVFNGAGNFDVGQIFADWASPLEIEAPSIGLKQFPCCGSTHPAITVAIKLAREEDIRPADIAAIAILLHERRLGHTNTPHPTTPLEAKFSVQYAVARALSDRAVRLADFEGEAHLEPAIVRLLDLVETRPQVGDRRQWGAEVIVTLKDGRTVSRAIDNLVGRGGDYPMSDAELWEKFEDCAARTLPREQIAPLFDRLETLDRAPRISDVTRLLAKSEFYEAPPRTTLAPRGASEPEETGWVP